MTQFIRTANTDDPPVIMIRPATLSSGAVVWLAFPHDLPVPYGFNGTIKWAIEQPAEGRVPFAVDGIVFPNVPAGMSNVVTYDEQTRTTATMQWVDDQTSNESYQYSGSVMVAGVSVPFDPAVTNDGSGG